MKLTLELYKLWIKVFIDHIGRDDIMTNKEREKYSPYKKDFNKDVK